MGRLGMHTLGVTARRRGFCLQRFKRWLTLFKGEGRLLLGSLKKFGSVSRLKLATLEQLAEVPGFGGKAAAELKAFLTARKEIRANP